MGKSEHHLPGAMDEPFSFVEEIASAYLREADGNSSVALRTAIRAFLTYTNSYPELTM